MVRFSRSWAFVSFRVFFSRYQSRSFGRDTDGRETGKKIRRNDGELLRRNHRLNSLLRGTLAEKMALLAVAEIPIVTHQQRGYYAPDVRLPDKSGPSKSHRLFDGENR